jgi:hypothetical protein
LVQFHIGKRGIIIDGSKSSPIPPPSVDGVSLEQRLRPRFYTITTEISQRWDRFPLPKTHFALSEGRPVRCFNLPCNVLIALLRALLHMLAIEHKMKPVNFASFED